MLQKHLNYSIIITIKNSSQIKPSQTSVHFFKLKTNNDINKKKEDKINNIQQKKTTLPECTIFKTQTFYLFILFYFFRDNKIIRQ